MPRKRLLTPEQLELIVEGADRHSLAAAFGVSVDVVMYAARVRGVRLGKSRRVSSHDWDSVDWGRRSVELAVEFGVTDSWIRRMRGRYGPQGEK